MGTEVEADFSSHTVTEVQADSLLASFAILASSKPEPEVQADSLLLASFAILVSSKPEPDSLNTIRTQVATFVATFVDTFIAT